VVGTTWLQKEPHLGHLPSERLDPVTEKCPHEVHPCQPPCHNCDLTHGLQLAEVLQGHPVPLDRKGNRAITSERKKRHGGVVPQIKPLLPPPFHQFGYGGVEIRINTMSELDMNDCTPRDCQLHVWVLWTPDTEEIIPQVEMGVNPHVGLTQSHKGCDVQDP
jgi:hypothetical protein